MNVDTILRLLKNSGFRVLGTDGIFIHMEDPSCILRSFEVFIDYAWIAITTIAGLLLFGWAISVIRGGTKANTLAINLRNLTLIFGILAAVKPIVNLAYGNDVFARGCKTLKISAAEVQRILDARNLKLTKPRESDLYEESDIFDSGAETRISLDSPYSESPVYAGGDIARVSVSSNYNGGIWGGQCTLEKNSRIFSNQSFTTGQYANSDPAFNKAINTIFRAEGGYVNDPFDSGGETKYGISRNNNPDIDVKNITRSDAERIAYNRYYKKYGIDKLPDGIRGEVFQTGWGTGPGVAIKQLQKILNVPKTGKIDDATLTAAQSYGGDLRGEYLKQHRDYLKDIAKRKPSQQKFLRGWMNRADLISENGCHS